MSESRSVWSRVVREPLVGFAVIGALLFVTDRMRPRDDDEAQRIVIDAPFVEGLRVDAARRTGHEPDATETQLLIDAWAREEALYREARSLQLDVGDTIVRRRLVQKIELLLAAEAVPDEPSDEELAAYLAAHADRYTTPTRSSVTLCFYARELHEDALEIAQESLAGRMRGVETECDPYLLGDTFRARTDDQLRDLVDDAAVAWLAGANLGDWGGPFENARGFYLVRLDAREPGGARPLAEVHDAVRDALLEERRAAAVRAREDEIVARYEVIGP